MTFIFLVVLLLHVAMAMRIAQKAGFSGWWGLTQLIPVVAFIMIWVLAFVDWPADDGRGDISLSTFD